MDRGIHFISGLPRSGSTLLVALLRQNSRFHATITGPVGHLVPTVMRSMCQDNEASVLLDEKKRAAVLRGLFTSYYADEHPERLVFDTHRIWAAKIAMLKALFPSARVICCVRRVPWIIDSLELMVQRHPLEVSKLISFDTGSTVYSRYEMVSGGMGLVGYAWNALRDAFFGPHRDRLMLLTYETLASEPARALKAVYDFIGEPAFPHRFDDLTSSAEDYTEYDARLGSPGLHSVRPQVQFVERPTILPPDLFRRVEKDSFWLEPEAARLGVPII